MPRIIKHYGTKRHSGRYPWGSGDNPKQRGGDFLAYVSKLRDEGLSEKERAKALGFPSTTKLRARITIEKDRQRNADRARAIKLVEEKGYSKVKAGEIMGINESTVRSLLDDTIAKKHRVTENTVQMLKDEVAEKDYIDIGVGSEHHIGIARSKMRAVISQLEDEGYTRHYIKTEQMGTGKPTYVMVLAKPGTEWKEVYANRDKIGIIKKFTDDGGETYSDLNLETPTNVSSKRIKVVYDEDGGSQKDGLIELRRGVDDISLGNSKYAQVRIAVDGTHYLKGMAVYSDDLPDGVDLRFNTNKSKDEGKLGVMKSMKDDPDNPFGSTVAQRYYTDKDGNRHLSALNIVNEEGNWTEWSKNLSKQMLSKQQPTLAKKQLEKTYELRKKEYDEIMELTNPTVKRKLLETFSDGADSASMHLKAAAMPRQATSVLIPIPEISDKEVYAPNFRDGEDVVLIRYPHGGRFEIPQLKVNNKYKEAREILGNARDAIGINHKIAERLSGADFDGDTVLVIPNKNGEVKVSSALKGLKDFDPHTSYKAPPSMPRIKPDRMQQEMGNVSNLITDMTIKGASQNEIARAVRHSMVIIDSEKHHLDYKKSYTDNRIADLKREYQGGARKGASTLISRSKSPEYVNTRDVKIDPKTGKKVYIDKPDDAYVNSKGKVIRRRTKSSKMLEVEDAHELSSGTVMESIYANHANKLKGLANDARKEAIQIEDIPYSRSARKAYQKEYDSLMAGVALAERNKPLERKAQLIANTVVEAKTKANPGMDKDDLKRTRNQAIAAARNRVGAKKPEIEVTNRQWEAIQAGAISKTALKKVIDNADLDRIKKLATPRDNRLMTDSKMTKAKTYLDRGYTRAQVADKLGVSVSTLDKSIN